MSVEVQPKKSFAAFKEEKAMGSLSPALNVMIKAVRKAGRKLLHDFIEIENLQVANYVPGDFVNKAISRTKDVLLTELRTARPNYAFEFADGDKVDGEDSSNTFLVNPLDGVINFAHAVPECAIVVTLLRDNDILAGVIYNPITDDLYYAEKGSGAFLLTPRGDRRLRVSGHKDLDESLLGMEFTKQSSDEMVKYQNIFNHFWARAQGIRNLGVFSLGFANVAAGKTDAYMCGLVKPETVGAGILMVREAGGHVRGFDGKEKVLEVLGAGNIIATNDEMDFAVTKLLRGKR